MDEPERVSQLTGELFLLVKYEYCKKEERTQCFQISSIFSAFLANLNWDNGYHSHPYDGILASSSWRTSSK